MENLILFGVSGWKKFNEYKLLQKENRFYITAAAKGTDYAGRLLGETEDLRFYSIDDAEASLVDLFLIHRDIDVNLNYGEPLDLLDYPNWSPDLQEGAAQIVLNYSNKYGLLGFLPRITASVSHLIFRHNAEINFIKISHPYLSLLGEAGLRRRHFEKFKQFDDDFALTLEQAYQYFFPEIKVIYGEFSPAQLYYWAEYAEPVELILAAVECLLFQYEKYDALRNKSDPAHEKETIAELPGPTAKLELIFEEEQRYLHHRFHSLYDLLWYNLLTIMASSNKNLVVCRKCKKPMVKAKPNAKYCSKSCGYAYRQKQYRDRKKN